MHQSVHARNRVKQGRDQSIGEHDRGACPEATVSRGQLVAHLRDEDEWHQLQSRQNPSTFDLPACKSHLLLLPLLPFLRSLRLLSSGNFHLDLRVRR